MKNLKQLLKERKYLEAKTLVLEDRENLEESIDTLIEAVEDARTTELSWNTDALKQIAKEHLQEEYKPDNFSISIPGHEVTGYSVGTPIYLSLNEGSEPSKEVQEATAKQTYTVDTVKNLDECVDNDEINENQVPKLAEGIIETPEGYKWWPDVIIDNLEKLEGVKAANYITKEGEGTIKFFLTGGDKEKIAKTIWENRQLGIASKGDRTQNFADGEGALRCESFDYIDLDKPSALEEA